MHSPFVFNFILNVLNNANGYVPPREIEELRRQLLDDQTVLTIEDHGAGSRAGQKKEKTIATLARTALKPPKYAQLLFRLVKYYQPARIVELGTSLGLTTAYLSRANPDARMISIEGNPSVYERAKEHLRELHCTNTELIQGRFDDVLSEVLQKLSPVSLGFVDGNHRYAPTIRYFHQFLENANEQTILVFDDIHWSQEMEQAWKEIQEHPSVTCTIDIFFLGFVFFRKEFRERQHFSIRF
jgi:predicted O-methyltransferase YrrM